MEFIGELVTGSAETFSEWISTLNHKSCNDAVKNSSVVQLRSCFLTIAGIGPLFCTSCEFNKVSNSLWCVIWVELDDDIAE